MSKEKLKHSNFSICISLNITEPTKKVIEDFNSSLETIFSKDNLVNIIKNKSEDEDYLDKIERVIVKHAIELAPSDNKLHSHSLIAISHRTKISLHNNYIRKQLKELNNLDYIPFVSVYVAGGCEKAAIISYLEYVNKED